MSPDDMSIFEWAFGGLGAIVLGWCGYNTKATADLEKDFNAHKVNVAENYAKRDSIEKVYDEIKRNTNAQTQSFSEVRKEMSDIKTLIITSLKEK